MGNPINNNIKLSHNAHEKNIQVLLSVKDERFFHIKNNNCINYQLIVRTLNLLKPLFNIKNSWLTVGDYNGAEANFLLKNGQDATASDISDTLLYEAKNENLITDYKKINVENISFPDKSFDYILCKESFHHFPRAYLGLYEMLRVSKKATIIIEPVDVISKMPALLLVKNILDIFNPLLINKIWKNRFSFETVGNYIFKISERDIEKIAMGIGSPCIAFKGINMYLSYDKNPKKNEVPINKKLWNKILRKIMLKDILCKFNIIPYNHLCCVIFNQKPDEEVLYGMKNSGYKIINLPLNPYLK